MILLDAAPAAVNHTFDYINIAALLLSPLIAVLITRWLQNRREERDHEYKNKFSVFATVIGERHALGYSRFFITAVNQIPIVFFDNESILDAYDAFIIEHTNKASMLEVKSQKLNDLIVEMAKELGYLDVNNSWISRHFYPEAAWAEYEARHQQNLAYLKENNLMPPTPQVKN